MRRSIRFITAALICLTGTFTMGQNNCENSLYEGNKLFEAGKFQECVDLLEPCLQSKKGKEEMIESYHLLAQAYQNIGNLEKANLYVKKMLSLNHDYQKYPNIDPKDFNRLVNQYSVSPKFYLGLKFGFNRNSVALKKSFSTYASSQSYLPKTGYQLGLTGDYRLKPLFSINADLMASGVSINHIVDNAGGWKQNYTEQQNYFSLLLNGQKHFKVGSKFSVYAGLGIGFNYLYSTNVFFEATNNETKTLQQSTQNPIDARNRFQTCANGLLGTTIPLPQGSLSIEANFGYYFGTTVNPDKRMSDSDFIFNNQYINDDVSLRMMMVNVCYKIPVVWDIRLNK